VPLTGHEFWISSHYTEQTEMILDYCHREEYNKIRYTIRKGQHELG
jgi:hypothetical protein